MCTHLSGGRLNVAILQETLRKELLNLLQLCEGKKVTTNLYSIFIMKLSFLVWKTKKCVYQLFQVTIWDEWLAGPVGLVAQYSLLKEHEVADMFPLRPGSLPTISVNHIIFIARPKLALMDLVADYILSLRYEHTHGIKILLKN